MSEQANDDTILFVDAGNCLGWVGEHWTSSSHGSVHIPMGTGCMGFSIPAAIGGKLAAPDKTVIAITGDAAFMMTSSEIHTAVEYGIAVIWVVLNNGGHGMLYSGEKLIYGSELFSRFNKRIDIYSLAVSLGAKACVVKTEKEFSDALENAVEENVPYVIDAHVSIEELPSVLKNRVETLNKYFGKEEREKAL